MRRPTGVTILAILYIIGGVITLLGGFVGGAVIGSGVIGEYAALGGLIILVSLIAGIFGITIGAFLLTGKSWARKLVMVLIVINIVISAVSLVYGNYSGILSIILGLIVLWYLRKRHVVEYFRGDHNPDTIHM